MLCNARSTRLECFAAEASATEPALWTNSTSVQGEENFEDVASPGVNLSLVLHNWYFYNIQLIS